jgi:hypothetical protein
MPKSQIADELEYDSKKVFGKGTLERLDIDGKPEKMKTFWVRVCQREHEHGHTAASPAIIAENCADGEEPGVFHEASNEWTLELPIRNDGLPPGTAPRLQDGNASVSAVLVFEAGDDLFTLAWSECVSLKKKV